MAAHRPLGDPVATVATPVPNTSASAAKRVRLVTLAGGLRRILRNPARLKVRAASGWPGALGAPGVIGLPRGQNKCYNGCYTLRSRPWQEPPPNHPVIRLGASGSSSPGCGFCTNAEPPN